MKVIAKNSVAAQEQEHIDPRLGARIRAARKEKGLTIRELAEKVGCSPTHCTRIELAQRRMDSMVLLTAFADALNIPTEELLTLAGQSVDGIDSYLKLAFPSIKNEAQENAITKFAKLVTDSEYTEEEMAQMLQQVEALGILFSSQHSSGRESKKNK